MHFNDKLFNIFKDEFKQSAEEVSSKNSDAKQWLAEQGGVDFFCEEQAKTITESMYKSLSSKSESEKLGTQ
jgi:hypothetical protein